MNHLRSGIKNGRVRAVFNFFGALAFLNLQCRVVIFDWWESSPRYFLGIFPINLLDNTHGPSVKFQPPLMSHPALRAQKTLAGRINLPTPCGVCINFIPMRNGDKVTFHAKQIYKNQCFSSITEWWTYFPPTSHWRVFSFFVQNFDLFYHIKIVLWIHQYGIYNFLIIFWGYLSWLQIISKWKYIVNYSDEVPG